MAKSDEKLRDDVQSKAEEALRLARQAAPQAHDWMKLHNVVFGVGGLTSWMFPTQEERVLFSKTKAYAEIRALIDELRETKGDPPPIGELVQNAKGNISVRVPRSVHAALLAEAEYEGVSLNQLILSKLCVQLQASVS